MRDLEDLERRFDNILFGHPFISRMSRRFPTEVGEWMPTVEMLEKADKFIVRAELPGMKKEDIDISVSDNNLTITGERKTESETKEEDYYCCERSYGRFFRSISLPSNIDSGKVSASLDEGVLEIGLPKIAQAKTKKVSVAAKKMVEGEKKATGKKAAEVETKTEKK
jgi:HSP20 family protein